jgi:hypothetical protein
MTEPFDSFEAELESLRPRELSPPMRQRIAERLERTSSSWKGRLAWSVVLAGGVAASVPLAIFLGRGNGRAPQEEPKVVTSQTPAPAAPDDRFPTVRAYQEALAKSPEAFEALLDKHARMWSVAAQPVQRANLWTPDSFLPEAIGDQ